MASTPAVPEMRLELVPVPVSDVDRAKAFYEQAGFGNLHDTQVTETMRVVQLTPPGSSCAIVFGTGMGPITDMVPGSVKGLHLVVDDMAATRAALTERGVELSDIDDMGGVLYSYFSDPDGNMWALQQWPAGYSSSLSGLPELTGVHAGPAGRAARVGRQGEPQHVDGFLAAPEQRPVAGAQPAQPVAAGVAEAARPVVVRRGGGAQDAGGAHP